MRLLIVSDSHGNSHILDELVEKYIDHVDKFVHCGDSELPDNHLVWNIMDTVSGNCDFYADFKDIHIERETAFPYAIVHGHHHNVKWTLEDLKEFAKLNKLSFMFYGHSHILKFDYEDSIFFINPGSIQSPRGLLREKTYCLLEANDTTVKIRVFDDQHEELPELFQKWELTQV